MYTTITVNGPRGSRFLSSLDARLDGRLPAPLAYLVREEAECVEVDTALADQIADFIGEELSADARIEPPLLFSPNIGDGIAIVRDVLVEFQIAGKRAPRIWRFVPRGTRGRVIAHQGDTDRVLIEPSREIAFVRQRSMTVARQ